MKDRVAAGQAALYERLTRTEAVARADLIAVQEYRVDLDLTDTAASDGFDSTTTVLFSCHRPGESTFVELKPSRLDEIRLNGVALDVAGLEGNRFPLTDLAGQNELVVRPRMRTSNTGRGAAPFRGSGGRVGLPVRAGVHG